MTEREIGNARVPTGAQDLTAQSAALGVAPSCGKKPELGPTQEAHFVAVHRAGGHPISELEELFSVTHWTVYCAVARDRTRMSSLIPTLPLGSASGVPGFDGEITAKGRGVAGS